MEVVENPHQQEEDDEGRQHHRQGGCGGTCDRHGVGVARGVHHFVAHVGGAVDSDWPGGGLGYGYDVSEGFRVHPVMGVDYTVLDE